MPGTNFEAADNSGCVYVAEARENRIAKFTSGGVSIAKMAPPRQQSSLTKSSIYLRSGITVVTFSQSNFFPAGVVVDINGQSVRDRPPEPLAGI